MLSQTYALPTPNPHPEDTHPPRLPPPDRSPRADIQFIAVGGAVLKAPHILPAHKWETQDGQPCHIALDIYEIE